MAAVDYFLKIDGIDGESLDSRKEKWIEIQSWSWGESNSSTVIGGAGGGTGKVSVQDLHFTAKVNKSSPQLMLACATGEHIKKATLTCRKSGGKQEEYLVIELENVLISSYQSGGAANGKLGVDDRPIDGISLNFQKMEYIYDSPFTGEIVDVSFDFGQVSTP